MDPPSLNFARGKDFQLSMRQKFGHLVVFSPGFRQREFTLVVSFCRARFRLDCHTVSVTLQSCFGGYPQGFRVLHLKDRSFKFSVASKAVGFEIYNQGRVVEKDFELVFNLWGFGGPNWLREEQLFYREEEASWTLVRSGSRPRYAASSFSGDQPRQSVFARLANFPTVSSNVASDNNVHSLPNINSSGEDLAAGSSGGNLARSNSSFQCCACGKLGHFAKECNAFRLPGLFPYLRFDTFPSPSPEAWDLDAVHDWF